MANHSMTRARLIETLERLPDDQLATVLDFIEELKRRTLVENTGASSLDPEGDPLLKYLGKVNHGSLAHDIDKALYDIT